MTRNSGVYTFIGSIALLLSLGAQAVRAEEILPWLMEGGRFIKNNGASIYNNTVSPSTLQYWTYTIPNNEVQKARTQFRSAAGGEFHRICTLHSADGDAGRRGAALLVLGSNDPSRFYFVLWREENGNINCYRRWRR